MMMAMLLLLFVSIGLLLRWWSFSWQWAVKGVFHSVWAEDEGVRLIAYPLCNVPHSEMSTILFVCWQIRIISLNFWFQKLPLYWKENWYTSKKTKFTNRHPQIFLIVIFLLWGSCFHLIEETFHDFCHFLRCVISFLRDLRDFWPKIKIMLNYVQFNVDEILNIFKLNLFIYYFLISK